MVNKHIRESAQKIYDNWLEWDAEASQHAQVQQDDLAHQQGMLEHIEDVLCNMSSAIHDETMVKLRQYGLLKCDQCDGTGAADSGGTYEWGEPIMVSCECTERPRIKWRPATSDDAGRVARFGDSDSEYEDWTYGVLKGIVSSSDYGFVYQACEDYYNRDGEEFLYCQVQCEEG